MKKILITGACGFLGTRIGAFLQKKGKHIHGFDKAITLITED